MPEIVVSIPVWDNTDRQSSFTRGIVSQILGETLGDLLLVVTDNASPHQGTRDFLDGLTHPRFRVVRYGQNEGVARGYNTGFLLGYTDGAQYFVAMNNDIVVRSPDWLERLVAPLRENPRLVVGPRRINYNLNVNLDGLIFDYIEGFMMAFHRQFLDEVGLFDEQFSPAYCEDVEICWRGQQHGFALREVAVPHEHAYGQTGYISVPDQKRIAQTIRNVRRLHDKVYRGDAQRIWYSLPTALCSSAQV
jgi:GT2 family glycosyltransferase